MLFIIFLIIKGYKGRRLLPLSLLSLSSFLQLLLVVSQESIVR